MYGIEKKTWFNFIWGGKGPQAPPPPVRQWLQKSPIENSGLMHTQDTVLTIRCSWRPQGLPELAWPCKCICKVDTSDRNHIERNRWMNGWSLGSSRRNTHYFQYITKLAYSAEKHGGCNTTCRAYNLHCYRLCISASRRAHRELKNWPCFDCTA